MQKKSDLIAVSREITRMHMHRSLKWHSHVRAQQPSLNTSLNSPRTSQPGQACDHRCLLWLIPRAESGPHLTVSARNSPEIHPSKTALRWVRCWCTEAHTRCTAYESPDERQQSFCYSRASITAQEAMPQFAICFVRHREGVAIPACDTAADLERSV
jgi:hypothetical protein